MVVLEFPVPEDRVKVFIGRGGTTKKMLEKSLGIKIDINVDSSIVRVKVDDPLKEALVKDIIDAISHGFNPDVALELANEGTMLYRINMREVFGKKRNTISRYTSRVIGVGGSIRKKIEEYTNTKISLRDDHIYIIGKLEDVLVAKEAIEKILRGSKHSTIITFLERKAMEKNLMLR